MSYILIRDTNFAHLLSKGQSVNTNPDKQACCHVAIAYSKGFNQNYLQYCEKQSISCFTTFEPVNELFMYMDGPLNNN